MTDLSRQNDNPLTLFERLQKCQTASSAAVLLERHSYGVCPPPAGLCRAPNCIDCWRNWLNSPVDMPGRGGENDA